MKFERLHIAGFGRLADVGVEFGDGLTIVAGPNEAGKSTIVECLLRLLFGYPESQHNRLRKRYEPWHSGTPYAASLRYRLDDGGVFEVARDFSKADVPTETVEADTRRPVPALTGNKSASPGEAAFEFSLDVYRAAAVVRAGDFADESNGAAHALADRLAALVGAAGDASAAEAIERLKKAYADIGLTGPNTPLGKANREAEEAERALRRFRDDHAGFEGNVRRQAELHDSVRDLAARRARCAAALAAVRLRSIRARITEAGEARTTLAAAMSRRAAIVSASPVVLARRDEVENAVAALHRARYSGADAATRASARDGERDAMQRDVDGAGAALMEKRAAVAKLDDKIAAHEAAAAGRPPISPAMLADLERAADEADVAESRARTFDTAAAIARQRSRPSALSVTLTAFGAVAVVAPAIALHSIALALFGAALFALAAALGFTYASAARHRRAAIARAEATAADAAQASERAAAALAARCRQLGCQSVAAVRAARTAQAELDRLRAERAAANEAGILLTEKREALQRRLSDVDALDVERISSQSRADEAQSAVCALLDELGMPPGSLDERLAAYRTLLDAGEQAARADAAVAKARATLERALAGATAESLEEDAMRNAAEAAAGGDAGEFADRSESDLDRELGMLDAQHREAERLLEGARAAIAEFERVHPVPAPELEERAAAAIMRRDRLKDSKEAIEIAWQEIETVKDVVHRDFTPRLNEAVGRSAATMTGGRYAQAWIDPADFTVRVQVPETGGSVATEALSTGTIEQFQFALRAAVASALGSGERVPILYDDALAHADEGRLKAALFCAAALAREGDQIVFFTQRGAVQALATELPGVRLVRLAGPGD